MRFLFGELRSISAQVSHVQQLEVEDTAKLDVATVRGAVGTADLSWSVRIPPKSYMEIFGEDGAIAMDVEGVSYRFKTYSEWKRHPNELDVKGAFARQIHYFVDAVLGQNPLGLGNDEGLAAQTIIEAAYVSVEHDRRMTLAPATAGTQVEHAVIGA
jgi:predicted dehydrogenase